MSLLKRHQRLNNTVSINYLVYHIKLKEKASMVLHRSLFLIILVRYFVIVYYLFYYKR